MSNGSTGAQGDEKWALNSDVRLYPADAVECGWSRELGQLCFRVLFPGRDWASVREVRTLLDDAESCASLAARATAELGVSAVRQEAVALFPRVAEEMLDYRIERARVVAEYDAIRFTKVNLKRAASAEVGVGVLRALASELGWTLREDEEGITVPVAELLPYFRRPLVRQLLDAKLAQSGITREQRLN